MSLPAVLPLRLSLSNFRDCWPNKFLHFWSGRTLIQSEFHFVPPPLAFYVFFSAVESIKCFCISTYKSIKTQRRKKALNRDLNNFSPRFHGSCDFSSNTTSFVQREEDAITSRRWSVIAAEKKRKTIMKFSLIKWNDTMNTKLISFQLMLGYITQSAAFWLCCVVWAVVGKNRPESSVLLYWLFSATKTPTS